MSLLRRLRNLPQSAFTLRSTPFLAALSPLPTPAQTAVRNGSGLRYGHQGDPDLSQLCCRCLTAPI